VEGDFKGPSLPGPNAERQSNNEPIASKPNAKRYRTDTNAERQTPNATIGQELPRVGKPKYREE